MLEAEAGDTAIIATLLTAAENFARSRGKSRLRGPFSLSINDECGLLIEGFDTPPAMMMGHAPPAYAKALDSLGYVKAKDLVTYELSVVGEVAPIDAKTARRSRLPGGVTVRSLNMRRFQNEIQTLVGIFNDAWSENRGFVPFTEAEVRHLATSLKPLIRPEFVAFAEIGDEPVGVFAAVPDLNDAIRGFSGKLLPVNWIRLLWRLKVGGVQRYGCRWSGSASAIKADLPAPRSSIACGRRCGWRSQPVDLPVGNWAGSSRTICPCAG